MAFYNLKIANDSQSREQMSSIDTYIINNISHDESNTYHHSSDNHIFEYEELFICMIDIVGFSKWCSMHNPQFIIETMIKYNTMINNLVNKHDDIYKIELVGDCCMLVSNMCNDNTIYKIRENGMSLLYFLNDFLFVNDDILKNTIFCSSDISFRVGIHVGHVYGTYLTKPSRFQLFSNEINVASRLESIAIPHTIHISMKALHLLWDTKNDSMLVNNDIMIKGKQKEQVLKGVGPVQSVSIFKRKHKILIVDDMQINIYVVKTLLTKNKYKVEETSSHQNAFELMKSYIYDIVILDLFYDDTNCCSQLQEFRKWESTERIQHQQIIGYSIYDVHNNDENISKIDITLFDVYINKRDTWTCLIKSINCMLTNKKQCESCDTRKKEKKTNAWQSDHATINNRCMIS